MQGPQLLTVPAFETGRYWIVPFSDSYLNFYTAIGSHFNSTAGQYLVVGPGKHHRCAYLPANLVLSAIDNTWLCPSGLGNLHLALYSTCFHGQRSCRVFFV